jgi:hypothetical protein
LPVKVRVDRVRRHTMPESASFSMRKKPNYRRRRTLAGVVLLLAAIVVVALLSRSTNGPGSKSNPIPTLAFVAKVTTVAQASSPDSTTRKADGDAIVKMFTDYYQEAFVDPRKWGDGQFNDLKDMFAKDAQTSFTKDLESLTIGTLRTQLKRVDPASANLVVTVYYDAKQKPTYAVAAASFNAHGTLKQTGPRVTIKQKATFYLSKASGGWTITSYDSDQSQDTPKPSPTASPS